MEETSINNQPIEFAEKEKPQVKPNRHMRRASWALYRKEQSRERQLANLKALRLRDKERKQQAAIDKFAKKYITARQYASDVHP